MARARLASYVALLILVLCSLSAPPAPAQSIRLAAAAPLEQVPWTPSPGLLVAEVVTGGVSASDELIELTNASAGPARPRRARGRVRHELGCDDHAQGVVDGVPGARPRAPPPDRQRPRHLRDDRGRDLLRGPRRDRWSGRAAGHRWGDDRLGRLGRRGQPVRGGLARGRTAGRILDRAPSGWRRRQWRRHQRQRRRLRGQRRTGCPEPCR